MKTLLFATALFFALPTFGQSHGSDARIRAPADALTLPIPYTLEFGHGATIDFADFTQHQPGPLRGYVYVKMQGELVLIPVYRPAADGTIWRAGQP